MAYFVIGVDLELEDIVRVSGVPRLFFEMDQVLYLSPYDVGGKNEPRYQQRKHDEDACYIEVSAVLGGSHCIERVEQFIKNLIGKSRCFSPVPPSGLRIQPGYGLLFLPGRAPRQHPQ